MSAPIVALRRTSYTRESVEQCITLNFSYTYSGDTITIKNTIELTGMLVIDWGDGTVNSSLSHSYRHTGNYIIRIYGDITAVYGDTVNAVFQNNNITKAVFNSTRELRLGTNVVSSSILREVIFGDNVVQIGKENPDYDDVLCRMSGSNVKVKSLCKKCTLNPYSLSSYNTIYGLRVGTFNIPDGCTAIPSHCFKNSHLSSIQIPEGVTSIGDSAFSGCSNLTEITLPHSLTSIGFDVFWSSNLTHIDYSHTQVSSFQQWGPDSAKTVKFPATTTSIEGTHTVNEVWVYSNNPPSLDGYWGGTPTVHVKEGKINTYLRAPYWSSSVYNYVDDL